MNWEWMSLRNLGTWFGGGTPSKANRLFWSDGDVPWLSPKDMGREVLSRTQDHITQQAVAESAARLVPAGSVAVVVRSGILERALPIAVVPFATTLNQDMKALAPRTGVLAEWVAWGLRASEQALLRSSRKAGTTVASLEWPRFLEQRIPVPALIEQRRIVEIIEDHLSRLDAATQTVRSNIVKLRALDERLIRDALTGMAEPGRRVAPALPDVGTHDVGLVPLPEGWAWKRLGDVARVVGGITKDAKKQSDPSLVEVPYLRVANVQRGALSLDDVTTIRVTPAKAAALALQAGDVLLNEGGDRDKLARGWVWEGQIPGCIHQNHVFRARLSTALNPYFLSMTANTFGSHWAQVNGKQSVNLASISLTMINKMPVIVPPEGTSTRVVQRVRLLLEANDRLRSALQVALARERALRRAVLAAAFSGRLTGSGSDDEVIEETAATMPAPAASDMEGDT